MTHLTTITLENNENCGVARHVVYYERYWRYRASHAIIKLTRVSASAFARASTCVCARTCVNMRLSMPIRVLACVSKYAIACVPRQ